MRSPPSPVWSDVNAPDTTGTPLAAAILAAGLGLRLGGRPKATLQIGGISLLERMVAALRGAGIQQISVVVGPYRDQLLHLAAHCRVGVIAHQRPDASLVDSQRLALKTHGSLFTNHDLLLVLADLPLLSAADVSPLLAAWQQRAPTVHAQMPMVDGIRGHPLLLSSYAVEQVSATTSNQGIRDWLNNHSECVRLIHSPQRAYITDLDTPDDLTALQARVHPTPVAWPEF